MDLLDKPLLTTSDVATVANRSRRTVEGWRYKGEGPKASHLGVRGIVYKQADVRAWLDSLEEAA